MVYKILLDFFLGGGRAGGGMEKNKNKSAGVIWRGYDVIYMCVSSNRSQQPMKSTQCAA